MANASGGAIVFYGNTNNNNFTGSFINNTAWGISSEDGSGNGGAITFTDISSNCIFTCDFINNTAVKHGGAINYRQTPQNITFNSNFNNNKASYGAGINFFESIENSEFNGAFIDNNAIYGGAIAAKSGVIKNILFKNNSAEFGGAIFFNGTGTVENCNFTNNIASQDGGAIYSEEGKLTVLNSKFINNTADVTGGALSFEGEELSIFESEFVNNTALDDCGAIFTYSNKATIIKSKFERNNAPEVGAVYVSCGNALINESDFISNVATDFVSAILNAGNLTVDNCQFIDSSADSGCTIRNVIYSTLTLSNSIFESDCLKGKTVDNNYGILYLHNNTINVQSSEIHNYGGNITSPCTAIALENKTITVAAGEKTTLTAIITDDNGNMIEEAYYVYFKINDELIESTYNPKTSRYEAEYTFSTVGSVQVGIACASINLSVQNGTCIAYSTFADLVAELNKCQNNTFELTRDYIYEHVKDANYTEGIVIDKADFTIDGQGHTIDGSGLARIFYITADNVTLKNINFINGNASYGGAIYWESGSNSQIINCIFKNNVASKSGGANFFNAGLTNVLISGEFIDNVAESGSGGANFFMDSVTNVTIIGDYSHNMANSNCNGSDKTGSGGANCFNKTMDNVIISGNYTDNIGYRGGANYFYSDGCNVSILGDYKNNTGLLFGGANYFMNSQTNINVIGDYINNKATNRGVTGRWKT